jgi:RimJ/RimL family protein N-acetyltransferase
VATLSPTVTLRDLVPADAVVISGWGADPAFARVADWSPDRTVADRTAFQERLITTPPPGLLRWGVEHEGSLVGFVNLADDEPGRRELGFLIGGSDRWSQGLGRAGAAAGLGVAFGDLGLEEVWAEAYDAHQRSVRILQGVEMRETGRGADGRFLGMPTFYRRFAITRGEWSATGLG